MSQPARGRLRTLARGPSRALGPPREARSAGETATEAIEGLGGTRDAGAALQQPLRARLVQPGGLVLAQQHPNRTHSVDLLSGRPEVGPGHTDEQVGATVTVGVSGRQRTAEERVSPKDV